MTGKYTGIEKRSVTFETLQDAIHENGKKLDTINGTVRRHKGNITEIFTRLKTIEDTELIEEGIRKGKASMKTSTRNMIIVVIMVLGCLMAGIRTFQTSQKNLMEKIESKILETKGDKG